MFSPSPKWSRSVMGPIHPPVQWIKGTIPGGGRMAGTWSWPLDSIWCWIYECVDPSLHCYIFLFEAVSNYAPELT